jgi:hypothetical protein
MVGQLREELGITFFEVKEGQLVEGFYRRSIDLGDKRYALIERSRDFTLVPWRPVLDQAIGKHVSAIMREEGGISWTIGRSRDLGVS